MNGLIPIAILHDSTCEPGEEWFFHGMAKPHDVHGSLESPIDPKDKAILDKDMEELRLREAKEQADADFNAFGCMMALAFGVVIVGIAIWAIW